MAGRRAILAATVLALGAYAVNARSMVCRSVGDTHIFSFEGRRFDAMGSGMWRLAKTKDGFFENQVKQKPWVQNREDVTVDTSMAQRCGPFVFEMNVDNDRTPGKLLVNKVPFSLKARETRSWDAKPSNNRPYSTRMTVHMQRVDGSIHQYRLTCRAEKAGGDATLIHTDVRAYSRRYGRRWALYSNVVITVQNSQYKDGDFTGLCGMTSSEEDNLVRANNCHRVAFKTKPCKDIVLVKDSENLAKDLKIAVKSAKAGLITLDAGRLAKKREHCMNLVSKVVPNLDDVPPTLRKELVDAASDCAYDTYFGIPSSTKGMKDALCEFGQEQIDIMRFKAAEQYRKMRCLFSPESALSMKGGHDMAMQRQQAEKISQAIACVLSTIEEFTFDGCEVKATEGLENSAAAKKCGGEGTADEEEEDAPVPVPAAGPPPGAAGPPPALLQLSGLRTN